MGRDDDYEFMTPHCFTYLQPVAETCICCATIYSDVIDIWRKQKFRAVATSKEAYYFDFTK